MLRLSRPCHIGLLVFGLVGCSPARAPKPRCSGDVGERGACASLIPASCYGPCSAYRVTVCEDGTVVYEGKRFVKTEGLKQRSLSAGAFARLMDELDGLPEGPSPLEEPVGGHYQRPYLWHLKDGHVRWIAERAPDGTPTADIFEERTGVREWIGTKAEREQLMPKSR